MNYTTKKNNQCIIALGSNQNNPLQQITNSLQQIAQHPNLNIITISSLYLTIPQSEIKQDNFINGAILLATELTPLQLLTCLQNIEANLNYSKKTNWGPRNIDLDIIYYLDHRKLITKNLIIPHPRFLSRDFVLQPMLELLPNFTLATGQSIQQALTNCQSQYIIKKLSHPTLIDTKNYSYK